MRKIIIIIHTYKNVFKISVSSELSAKKLLTLFWKHNQGLSMPIMITKGSAAPNLSF